MTRAIDDTLLLAYADGELDGDMGARVEREVDRNPALARRLAGYRQDSALLRSALQSALYASPRFTPPSTVYDEAHLPWYRLIGRLASSRSIPWALAASMSALALGMSIDRVPRVSPAATPFESVERSASFRYSNETLEASLERSVSGVSSAWRNPDTGASGDVTPVRTFRTSDGRYCREFRETQWHSAGRTETGGIACRQFDGAWKVRIRYYPD